VGLHPLIISHTDLGENPHPLAVVWGGPVVGSALPLLAFAFASVCRLPGVYLFRFFAGFCLVANGVYIGIGWLLAQGADPWVMIDNGSPKWCLFCSDSSPLPLGYIYGIGKGRTSGSAQAMAMSAFAPLWCHRRCSLAWPEAS